jgi:hypothetical protein
MSETIELHCENCGHRMAYERSIDASLPPDVVRIETSGCDKCDDGGGFIEEHLYRADGTEIIPD